MDNSDNRKKGDEKVEASRRPCSSIHWDAILIFPCNILRTILIRQNVNKQRSH